MTNSNWQEFPQYHVFLTEDGSPSLKFGPTEEPMHDLKGAFSESLAIYYHPMKEVFEKFGQLSVLSVGLGLGYNEMLFAALLAQINNAPDGSALSSPSPDYSLYYFEKNEFLIEQFDFWLLGKTTTFQSTYDLIGSFIEKKLGIAVEEIKAQLRKCQLERRLLNLGELHLDSKAIKKCNCILYDPFSSRTNPELWEEKFLNLFLEEFCAENCLLTSYASKGTLKRALKNKGFVVELLPGHAGKRNRIVAWRYSC